VQQFTVEPEKKVTDESLIEGFLEETVEQYTTSVEDDMTVAKTEIVFLFRMWCRNNGILVNVEGKKKKLVQYMDDTYQVVEKEGKHLWRGIRVKTVPTKEAQEEGVCEMCSA
jgi:hypothetical protein